MDMYHLLPFFFLLNCIVNIYAYNSDVYFKYPENLIPDKDYLQENDDFILGLAANYLETRELGYTKELLLITYQYSESVRGFVFDSQDVVKYVLIRNTNKKTYRFGKLVRENGLHFYERVPEKYEDNTIFIERFYDFDNMNKKKLKRGRDTNVYCFIDKRDIFDQTCYWSSCQVKPNCRENEEYTGQARYSRLINDESYCDSHLKRQYECCSKRKEAYTSLREACAKIPKCLGYIEGTCLVSHAALSEPLTYEPQSSFTYYEKRRQHTSIVWIQDNWNYVLALVLGGFFLILLLPENISPISIWEMEINYSWLMYDHVPYALQMDRI